MNVCSLVDGDSAAAAVDEADLTLAFIFPSLWASAKKRKFSSSLFVTLSRSSFFLISLLCGVERLPQRQTTKNTSRQASRAPSRPTGGRASPLCHRAVRARARAHGNLCECSRALHRLHRRPGAFELLGSAAGFLSWRHHLLHVCELADARGGRHVHVSHHFGLLGHGLSGADVVERDIYYAGYCHCRGLWAIAFCRCVHCVFVSSRRPV